MISIHALLAESDTHKKNQPGKSNISIHALLAESDASNQTARQAQRDFYPRSPCGERLNEIPYQRKIDEFLSTLSLRRATMMQSTAAIPILFLSTLSLRRATCYSLRHSAQGWHFYPRSPCGERPDPGP